MKVLSENSTVDDDIDSNDTKSTTTTTTTTTIHSMEVVDSSSCDLLPSSSSSNTTDQPQPPPSTTRINNPTVVGTRKRRMSKKERKDAMKKRKKVGSVPQDDAKKVTITENDAASVAAASAKGCPLVKSVEEPAKKVSIQQLAEAKLSVPAIETMETIEQTQPKPPQSSLLRIHEEEEIRFKQECLKSYSPIPIPTVPSPDVIPKNTNYSEDGNKKKKDENGKTTLGKWFPNALLVKCPVNYTNTGKLLLSGSARRNNKPTSSTSTKNNKNDNDDATTAEQQQQQPSPKTKKNNPRSSLLLFYQYININNNKEGKWSQTQLQLLMTYLATVAKQRHIGGRIRVAQEGVNVTVSAVDISKEEEDAMGGGGDGATTTAKETLRHFVQDLQNFDPVVFASDATDFKYIDDLPPDRHFKELKVMPVQELVFYGVKEEDKLMQKQRDGRQKGQRQDGNSSATSTITTGGGGVHLDADEYHKMLQQSNTVVIDVRNHYETVLGRFDGQGSNKNTKSHNLETKTNGNDGGSHATTTATTTGQSHETVEDTYKTNSGSTGAEYMDPLMRKSTDFPSWLAKDETKKRLRDKTVLMYCTGGIRCERASSYLKERMGNEVNGVYQLRGGVERYLKAFPDGGFWRGKNFVFDKREAVGVDNLDGDGGVIQKKKKKKNAEKHQEGGSGSVNASHEESEDLPSRCCVCNNKWDRYVGKKKCYTCGVPVLMCDACMSTKPDKTKGKELSVRCPLCVTENVTVPASEVEFTANGIRGTVITTSDTTAMSMKEKAMEGTNKDSDGSPDASIIPKEAFNVVVQERKAAESVLKWGGGHATKKKDARQKKKDAQQMKRRLCQYGSECFRKDCFFAHPERQVTNVSKK